MGRFVYFRKCTFRLDHGCFARTLVLLCSLAFDCAKAMVDLKVKDMGKAEKIAGKGLLQNMRCLDRWPLEWSLAWRSHLNIVGTPHKTTQTGVHFASSTRVTPRGVAFHSS